jgi:tRNA uridine 5-carbamoylmethylation protein Kti12
MIVVEGPDNSGKSTLIKQLRQDFGIRLISPVAQGPTRSLKDLYDRSFYILNSVTKARDSRVIVDRINLISEEIYGPICRGRNLWDGMPKEKQRMWTSFNILKPFIIYCRPPLEVLKNMNTHQVKTYDTPQHLRQISEKQDLIIKAYDNYFANWRYHNFFIYNYKDPDSYFNLTCLLKEYLGYGKRC